MSAANTALYVKRHLSRGLEKLRYLHGILRVYLLLKPLAWSECAAAHLDTFADLRDLSQLTAIAYIENVQSADARTRSQCCVMDVSSSSIDDE